MLLQVVACSVHGLLQLLLFNNRSVRYGNGDDDDDDEIAHFSVRWKNQMR